MKRQRKIEKGITTAFFVFIILGLLTSCSEQQAQPNTPITIGALFPLTGGLSSYGEAAQKSAQLALDEINAEGGINGRPLIIDFQDHACDPKTAVSIFQQVTDAKKIKIFTSAACSGTVLAIAPLLEQKDALLVGTIVTTPKITNVSEYVFRNWASDAKEALLIGSELKKSGFKNVGIIYEQTDYAQGLKIGIERPLNGSGINVMSESFASGATDVRTQLQKLKNAGVDALFISPQTTVSADMVLKELQELNFKPQLYVNDNVIKAVTLISKYNQTLEGAIGADYVVERTPAFNALLSKYKQKYGSDCAQTNICAGVYDAVKLIAQALREKGESVEDVRAYLKSTSYEGASGTIGFDENNDRTNTAYSLFEVHNGVALAMH